MSDVNKEVKKSILDKKTILFLIGITVVGMSVYVYLNIMYPPEDMITIESKKEVMEDEIIKEVDKLTFDRCTDMLIVLVGVGSTNNGEQMGKVEQVIYDNVMFEYKKSGCFDIEFQTSHTMKYENRNSPDNEPININKLLGKEIMFNDEK